MNNTVRKVISQRKVIPPSLSKFLLTHNKINDGFGGINQEFEREGSSRGNSTISIHNTPGDLSRWKREGVTWVYSDPRGENFCWIHWLVISWKHYFLETRLYTVCCSVTWQVSPGKVNRPFPCEGPDVSISSQQSHRLQVPPANSEVQGKITCQTIKPRI